MYEWGYFPRFDTPGNRNGNRDFANEHLRFLGGHLHEQPILKSVNDEIKHLDHAGNNDLRKAAHG